MMCWNDDFNNSELLDVVWKFSDNSGFLYKSPNFDDMYVCAKNALHPKDYEDEIKNDIHSQIANHEAEIKRLKNKLEK
jgi:hypothetical protein